MCHANKCCKLDVSYSSDMVWMQHESFYQFHLLLTWLHVNYPSDHRTLVTTVSLMFVEKCRGWFKSSSSYFSSKSVPATPLSVTTILLGECYSPTNLLIIVAGLGTCHQGTTNPQCPIINTIRPLGGPCYPRGCQYCRLGIKEHFISVCDSKKESFRSWRASMDVQGGLCILNPPPPGRF